MSLQERLERSLRNPYPVLDVEIDRFRMFADEAFPYRTAAANSLLLLLDARKAANEYSASYRDFRVGATVVAYKSDERDFAIFNGANVKVDETDLINVHAEDTAVGKAEDKDYDLISFVGVVGHLQNDQTSGVEVQTLHPCGRCRKKFSESHLISDKTIFMSANMDLTTIEMYTLQDLEDFHVRGDKSAITTFHTEPEAMDWDDKVAPYIGQFVMRVVGNLPDTTNKTIASYMEEQINNHPEQE